MVDVNFENNLTYVLIYFYYNNWVFLSNTINTIYIKLSKSLMYKSIIKIKIISLNLSYKYVLEKYFDKQIQFILYVK